MSCFAETSDLYPLFWGKSQETLNFNGFKNSIRRIDRVYSKIDACKFQLGFEFVDLYHKFSI